MRETQVTRWQQVRLQVGEWIEAPRQQAFIVAAILVNTLTLALGTVPALQERYGHTLDLVDHLIIGIFVLEITLKLCHSGGRFFTGAWNVFDFVIVAIALLPASGVFSALRTLRILRALRLLNKLRQLRNIVEMMLRSLPGLGWITVLLSILFFVFGIIGATLFGTDHPELFGNLAVTFYTLFELMTLEGWTTTARTVMSTHPHAYLFFVPFLLLASYTLLNLVIGVIVSSMEGLHLGSTHEDETPDPDPTVPMLMAEMRRLHDKLDRLERRLAEQNAELEPAE